MNDQPCPYVVGTTTKYCVLSAPTLTDAEREAVAFSARRMLDAYVEEREVALTLRGLLERTK